MSFKIGVPIAYYDRWYSADVWPVNARFKPTTGNQQPWVMVWQPQNPTVTTPTRLFVSMELQANSNHKSLNIFYQNVRGIKTKLTTWRNILSLLEHNIVGATEIFHDGSVGDMEVLSKDWTILRRDRSTQCGGVLLAAHPPILLHHHPEFESDTGVDLWASFMWRGRSIYICVVYIKPRAKMQTICNGSLKLKLSLIM